VATGVGRGRSRPPSNLATKNASTTIPVVFMTGADPGKMGLVTNLRQSGGNVTGITFFSEELGTKAVSLLRDLVSGAKTYGLMVNPNNPETPRRSADAAEAAHPLGLTMEVLHVATPPDIDNAFNGLSERRVEALLLGADAFYGGRVQQFVSLAARHKMPAMYYRREFAEAGGLASYGASVPDAYRQAGVYVARVLRGEKPVLGRRRRNHRIVVLFVVVHLGRDWQEAALGNVRLWACGGLS
jgi:putative tryptophan/tyrosine transport system substrate-binding protein